MSQTCNGEVLTGETRNPANYSTRGTMSLFTGTTEHYRQYRPGLPEAVASVLANATTPGNPSRLLDLGTGTGLVVQALLNRFDDIIAIDPDPTMLAATESSVRPNLPEVSRLRLFESSAEAFTPPNGWRADLVTICRTFHWLDQSAVLARLDSQVAPDGAIAIFADSSFWTADSPWKRSIRAVVQDFLGKERRAGSGTFTQHNRPYSDIMKESPFDQVEEIRIPVHRVWNAAGVLGYLYSTSFAAPHLFEDRLDEFETAVKAALARHRADDVFVEENEFLIRIGRRGAE